MKQHTTILCLTLITIVSMFTGYIFFAAGLWIGYGLYKSDF